MSTPEAGRLERAANVAYDVFGWLIWAGLAGLVIAVFQPEGRIQDALVAWSGGVLVLMFALSIIAMVVADALRWKRMGEDDE